MDKDNSSINNYNHSVSLLERKTLVITDIMVIKGDELELIKLDTLSGNVTIKGTVSSIDYLAENNKKSSDEGFISRLFKY